MIEVMNVFGQYVQMNEEDIEELLREHKELMEKVSKLEAENKEIKRNVSHLRRCAEVLFNL